MTKSVSLADVVGVGNGNGNGNGKLDGSGLWTFKSLRSVGIGAPRQ